MCVDFAGFKDKKKTQMKNKNQFNSSPFLELKWGPQTIGDSASWFTTGCGEQIRYGKI